MDPNIAWVVWGATFINAIVRGGFDCLKVVLSGRIENDRERIKSAKLERTLEQLSGLSSDANSGPKRKVNTETGEVEITPSRAAPHRGSPQSSANRPRGKEQRADWISRQRAEGRGGDAE